MIEKMHLYLNEGSHTIVHLSDLHEENYEEIFDCLKGESFDEIYLTGDFLERKYPDRSMDIVETFRKKEPQSFLYVAFKKFFSKKYHDQGRSFLNLIPSYGPSFYSLGNHEWYFLRDDRKAIDDSGLHFLNNEDILYNGHRIGALSPEADESWLREYSEKDGFKILMMHHPDQYELYKEYIDRMDLVLCGHCHGGQWIFFNRGIFAPGQGILPRYYKGDYPLQKGHMIVSPGLSNPTIVPRLFNPKTIYFIHY